MAARAHDYMPPRTAVAIVQPEPLTRPGFLEEAMRAHGANANHVAGDPAGTAEPMTIGGMRFSEKCGCTEFDACTHPEHGNCWWVGPNLCSHCLNGWGDSNG